LKENNTIALRLADGWFCGSVAAYFTDSTKPGKAEEGSDKTGTATPAVSVLLLDSMMTAENAAVNTGRAPS